MSDERKTLERAFEEATAFLDGLGERSVAPRLDVDGVEALFDADLPIEGVDPLTVVDELIAGAEPGSSPCRPAGSSAG